MDRFVSGHRLRRLALFSPASETLSPWIHYTGLRAGTQTAYYHGDDVAKLSEYAWHTQGTRTSQPAGQKLPNELGLYDMLGNVWEIASDLFEIWKTDEPKVDPSGPVEGSTRVLRGGCSYNKWDQNRCAMRHPISATYADPAIGMRLLCEID